MELNECENKVTKKRASVGSIMVHVIFMALGEFFSFVWWPCLLYCPAIKCIMNRRNCAGKEGRWRPAWLPIKSNGPGP